MRRIAYDPDVLVSGSDGIPMGMSQSINYTVPYAGAYDYLAPCASDEFSQFGEDGIIEAIFQKIHPANQFCFEVGASDGVTYSNIRKLVNLGWTGLFIEKNDELCNAIEVQGNSRSHCEDIMDNGLDDVLARFNWPQDVDLGVIDIDGQDYWAWHDMTLYRPRVLMVEFSRLGEQFIPERGGSGQATRDMIEELGKSKRYVPVVRTLVNAIFVRGDVVEAL